MCSASGLKNAEPDFAEQWFNSMNVVNEETLVVEVGYTGVCGEPIVSSVRSASKIEIFVRGDGGCKNLGSLTVEFDLAKLCVDQFLTVSVDGNLKRVKCTLK